jgi:uncharacterized C2H2 Zn-finger protein
LHGPNEIECKDKLHGKLCGKLIQTKWDYQWHEINEHKPFTCPICGSKFKEEKFLKHILKTERKKTMSSPKDSMGIFRISLLWE